MLNFIERFDPDLFSIASGPEGLLPSVRCLQTNNMWLFYHIPHAKNIYKCMLSDVMYYPSIMVTIFFYSQIY